MKRKRHTTQQIITKLREAEALLGQGGSTADVSKKLGVSETTFHRWRARYGGLQPAETRRLRELEKENTRLKRIVADQAVDISILREVAKGNF